jgi:hypothetical protein
MRLCRGGLANVRLRFEGPELLLTHVKGPKKSPPAVEKWNTSRIRFRNLIYSVADPDPRSGAFLNPGPGSGIRNWFFFGSRIPTPYILGLSDKFLGKKFYNSLKTGPYFFFSI